jgi:hypothetical protein
VKKNFYNDNNHKCVICGSHSCDHYLYSSDAEQLDIALSSNNTTLKAFAHYLYFSKSFGNIIHADYYYKNFIDKKHATAYFLEACAKNKKKKEYKSITSSKYEDNLSTLLNLLTSFIDDRDHSYTVTKNLNSQYTKSNHSIYFSDDDVYIHQINDIISLCLMKQSDFDNSISKYEKEDFFVYNSSLQIRDLLHYELKIKPQHIAFTNVFVDFFGGFFVHSNNFISKKHAKIIFEGIFYFKGLHRAKTYPQDLKIRAVTNILHHNYKHLCGLHKPTTTLEYQKQVKKSIYLLLRDYDSNEMFVTYSPIKRI